MKKVILAIILSSILFSCKTKFNVVNVNDTKDYENSIVYNLPKTALNIAVEIEEIHSQKGPFYKYAEKYLGTKNFISSDDIEYRISKIKIETYSVPDSAQFYAIKNASNTGLYYVSLTPQGYIAGINLDNIQTKQLEQKQEEIKITKKKNEKLNYAEFSINSVRETKYDTLYKEIYQDSVFVTKPIIKKKTVFKTPEKQAKELSDQIFLLRDDRNALLKGESDGGKNPDGVALPIMIKELNKLETEYMQLFTGRSTSIKKYYNFKYVPENKNIKEEKILFNFTKTKGINTNVKNTETPVIIELLPDESFLPVQKYSNINFNNNFKRRGIFYRMPAYAFIKIKIGNKVITQKKIQIAQYGSINYLPVSLFDEEINIEFYPETGALKKISKQRK